MDILFQPETLFLIFIMVITAIPAGFAAGLFGIGGGLITVPILFYIFGSAGIEPTYLMHNIRLFFSISWINKLFHSYNNYLFSN